MHFEFLRPVFTGDSILCEMTIDKYEKEGTRNVLIASFICSNQQEKLVLTGSFSEIIL